MQIEFLCNRCVNELTKFIKKTEKSQYSFNPTPSIHKLKFQDQIHKNERAVKRQHISNFTNLSEISLF
jgi:copper chaperone CopZ